MQEALERRMQRTLVVKEKQKDIVQYRKVTIAELRLRRQVPTTSHIILPDTYNLRV